MRVQSIPKFNRSLKENKKACEAWHLHWSGDDDLSLFEVSKCIDKFLVSLKEHTCSCRKWELTGIPCPHSITCMWLNGVQPKASVSSYYKCCFVFIIILLFLDLCGN